MLLTQYGVMTQRKSKITYTKNDLVLYVKKYETQHYETNKGTHTDKLIGFEISTVDKEVKAFYGGITKVIPANQTNYKLYFGTWLSEDDGTPDSGVLIISGDYIGFKTMTIPTSKQETTAVSCLYGIIQLPVNIHTIYPDMFSRQSGLVSVKIPRHISSIGSYAFSSCSSLQEITFPKGLTNFGMGTFDGTKWLSEQRALNPLVIVNNCLIDASTATGNIVIPDGVVKICDGAIYLSEITSLILSDSVTHIGEQSIARNYSMASLTLSNSLIEIGNSAFWDNPAITTLVIPESVVKIGLGAFLGCSSLQTIVMGDSVSYFGDDTTDLQGGMFEDCISLTEIRLPESIAIIPYNCFKNCRALKSVTIPNNVQTIQKGVFYGCISLQEIFLPFIGKSRNAQGTERSFGFIFGTEYYTGTEGHTAAHAINQYYETGLYTTYYLPNSFRKVIVTGTNIPPWAFNNIYLLREVEVGKNVDNIGERAFYGCTYLYELWMRPSEPPILADPNVFSGDMVDLTIYVPHNAGYESAPIWSYYAQYMMTYS